MAYSNQLVVFFIIFFWCLDENKNKLRVCNKGESTFISLLAVTAVYIW